MLIYVHVSVGARVHAFLHVCGCAYVYVHVLHWAPHVRMQVYKWMHVNYEYMSMSMETLKLFDIDLDM